MKIQSEKMRAFLIDLREVLEKHDAILFSCSCCNGLCAEIIETEELIEGAELGPDQEYEFSVERIDYALKAEQ